jgi:hypothetical protein
VVDSAGLRSRLCDFDGDSDLDLAISARTQLYLLMNEGSPRSPEFNGRPVTILPQWGPAPVHADQLLDWNGDGRIDLVQGFRVRINNGSANPWSWTESVSVLQARATIEHRSGRGDEEHSTLLDDFDGDGVIDVLFGDWFGHVWLHRNRGTGAEPDFDLSGIKLPTQAGVPIKVGPIGGDPNQDFTALQGARTVVTAGDFDGDGRRDLVVGDTFGKVRYFRQLADDERITADTPTFADAVEIGDLGIRLNVSATDWNEDGRMDVIAGSANGRVQVFLSAAAESAALCAGLHAEVAANHATARPAGRSQRRRRRRFVFSEHPGACFVERSFLNGGYARGEVE